MYENTPSAEWQDMFLGLRSEDQEERAAYVEKYVASFEFQITPMEFIQRDKVEPFPHPNGGTIWLDLSQLLFQEKPNIEWDVLSKEPRRWSEIQNTAVNQVLVAEPEEEWWDTPLACIFNIPFRAIWDPLF
jgi:hypothetical protein